MRITTQKLKYSWKTGSIPRPVSSTSLALLYMIFVSARHLKWWKQDQTRNLLISNPRFMAEKVSEILFTAWLGSIYILQQGQNIKNFFSLKGYMVPITTKYHQMIDIAKMTRRKSCDVYNVLHPNCAGAFSTVIFLTTMYTWLDYI